MKGLEELVSYYKQQLKDSEWRYQQLLENLSSSQRTVEAFARALPEHRQRQPRAPKRKPDKASRFGDGGHFG